MNAFPRLSVKASAITSCPLGDEPPTLLSPLKGSSHCRHHHKRLNTANPPLTLASKDLQVIRIQRSMSHLNGGPTTLWISLIKVALNLPHQYGMDATPNVPIPCCLAGGYRNSHLVVKSPVGLGKPPTSDRATCSSSSNFSSSDRFSRGPRVLSHLVSALDPVVDTCSMSCIMNDSSFACQLVLYEQGGHCSIVTDGLTFSEILSISPSSTSWSKCWSIGTPSVLRL